MRRLLLVLFAALTTLAGVRAACAVDAIRVPPDSPAIDLSQVVSRNFSQGDKLQVSTAPDKGGVVRRIEVDATKPGTQPSWIVFALTNDTDDQIERLLVAPHFRLVGSGVINPDLGSRRVAAITASQGFPPEVEEADDAAIFRLTLDPGTTVTYVAELASASLPQLYLWDPDAYKDKEASLTLYKGILIGVAGLLALFLTIVFVVKGTLVFPAAAALAWSVLIYVCIDFGFWLKILGSSGPGDQVWRASAETLLAATMSVFLFAYLNLASWHVRASTLAAAWLLLLAGLLGLAVYDPSTAAGVARVFMATVAVVGFILVLFLAAHGHDRAIMLLPTWFSLLAWMAAAGAAVGGFISNDLVSPALIGGLVLIIMLIGFTIMQIAFAGGGLAAGVITDAERKALALMGSGDVVFDWDVLSDTLYVGPEPEELLGLKRGALLGPASGWFDLLHPSDRDRYRACLDTVLEQRRGRLNADFRLRGADGHYLCFQLKARPVVNTEGDVARVVGTLSDVTQARGAEDRILQDSVHDNLTGLPHRELFFDRLDAALRRSAAESTPPPAVIAIDLDRFRDVNIAAGPATGDSILLTAARRLGRQIGPLDALARVTSDEFAIIVDNARDTAAVMQIADIARRAIATPMTFNEHAIALTASVGVALCEPQARPKAADLLRDAELALAHAKRFGGNRVEVFRAAMRQAGADKRAVETDLRGAAGRGELKVELSPIVRLDDRTIAGFEARLRWDHPRLGRLDPVDFMPVAEDAGLVGAVFLFMLDRAARELAAWQDALDVSPPILVNIPVASRGVFRHDLLNEVKTVLTRSHVKPGSLRLEIREGMVMENPEFSAQMLPRLRDLGAGLALAGFGSGQSSLAHLQRFPFDALKIGKMFVHPAQSGARPLLLRSIIGLAHDIGMEVVAEGAENESDVIELFQMGCEYAQGPAFGRSMNTADVRALLGAAADAA